MFWLKGICGILAVWLAASNLMSAWTWVHPKIIVMGSIAEYLGYGLIAILVLSALVKLSEFFMSIKNAAVGYFNRR